MSPPRRRGPNYKLDSRFRGNDNTRINSALLNWYKIFRRDLPWRRKPAFYTTLLSEFMLQQTRVDQAIPYYHRFLKELPTLRSLADTPLGKVMKLWEGLGYYRRAKHLHETAKILAGKRKIDKSLLGSCPGIGDYTLAAISSIVWGEPLAVVDGNVKRVVARFLGLRESIDSSAAQEKIRRAANLWLYRKASGDWNQAMMELGATVCTPRGPLCGWCPLSFGCSAFKSGDQENLPVKSKKAPRPHKRMVSAVIVSKKSEFLILRRPNGGLLSNLWEFPNIEIRKSKNIRDQLKNYLSGQGLEIDVEKKIAVIDHAYSHFSVTMEAFFCRLVNDSRKLNHRQKTKWVSAGKLARYPFPKVHKPVLVFLKYGQNHQSPVNP